VNNINFDSRKNYLKQILSGWQTMDKPNLTDALMAKRFSEYTVTHNLGYRPIVRAWYDPNGTGQRFPLNGQRTADISQFYLVIVPFQFYARDITTTSVTFRADNYTVDGSFTGTFRFFYSIYADPSLGRIQ